MIQDLLLAQEVLKHQTLRAEHARQRAEDEWRRWDVTRFGDHSRRYAQVARPSTPIAQKPMLQILEALLRAHGGELVIRKSIYEDLRGEVEAESVYADQEYTRLVCTAKKEGRWNPDAAAPYLVDDDTLSNYAHELHRKGVTAAALSNAGIGAHRHFLSNNVQEAALKAVEGIVERLIELEEERAQEEEVRRLEEEQEKERLRAEEDARIEERRQKMIALRRNSGRQRG